MNTKAILTALIGLFSLSTLLFQSCSKEDESNKSPSCEITSPSEGEECKQKEIVTITVTTADSDGTISAVLFYIDGANIGTVNTSPYNYDWDTEDASIGNHIIKATSIDNEGANRFDEVTVEIIKGEGSYFTASPTNGDAPLTVNFTDQSTNSPTSWAWDFGDGNNSTEQNPTHIYNEMGLYDVILTTTGANGSDTETKSSFIIVKGTMTDMRDNQTYSIVTIGEQTWFAENLNYETADSWWYQDDETNGNLWGRLYTWDVSGNACPDGWHLPLDNEWKKLEMYLGMSKSEADKWEYRGEIEGEKLKSTEGWKQDGNGIDIVGFKALPGGMRDRNGAYSGYEGYGTWWTASEDINNQNQKNYRFLESDIDKIGRNTYHHEVAYSVRCVKND